jgi:hypothetical protein
MVMHNMGCQFRSHHSIRINKSPDDDIHQVEVVAEGRYVQCVSTEFWRRLIKARIRVLGNCQNLVKSPGFIRDDAVFVC